MYVDSHAHVDGPEYAADLDEVLERARAAGVSTILTVGTGNPHTGEIDRAVRLAERHANVYASVGVHPHDAKLFDEEAVQKLNELVGSSRRVVAWGEIGLDYHYDNSPRDVQRRVFAHQLELARQAKLPVIIHSREAETDTIDVLQTEWSAHGGACFGGVMHCFSGSPRMAEQALGLGMMISFAGNLTFKKAESLREVAGWVPLDRVLIETDCPYLAPVPLRGRRNEPSFVVHVAECLAALRDRSAEEIGRITGENFTRLFNVPVNVSVRAGASQTENGAV